MDEVAPDGPKVRALKAALRLGLVGDGVGVALLIDFVHFRASVRALVAAFHHASAGHGRFLHTCAAKANPLYGVLREAAALGLGCEAASLGELAQALRTMPKSRVIFDSPAKTRPEIRFAIEKGVLFNIDNFQELARVDELLKKVKPRAAIGIRINPQVGEGHIKDTSTGSRTSKFGIPLLDHGQELLEEWRKRPWLTMVHVHVGSQGVPLSMIADGIRAVVDFALRVNRELGRKQIEVIDIGGGLPVNFQSEEMTPTFAEYAAVMKAKVPELFTGEFLVITEFGRALLAKAGFIVARVEYTKKSGDRYIAVTQAGADIAVRTVYQPEKWPVRVTVHWPNGELKKGETCVQDIAGPCCFSGDVIAHQRELVHASPDDWIAVHDTGAYYHSAFSRYNSRQAPPVYSFTYRPARPSKIRFRVLKEGETVKDTLAFFTPKSKL